MNIDPKELFEIIGRKEAQVQLLTRQLNQASTLIKQMREEKPKEKPKGKKDAPLAS